MNRIFTLGYSGVRVAELMSWVERWDAVVIDTRLVPWSKNPIWTRPALVDRLRGRYLALGDCFGNRRYRDSDPAAIDLVDATRGVFLAARLLRSGSVLLLCLEASWEVCHRREAASLIHEATGAPVCHLEASDLSSQGRLAL